MEGRECMQNRSAAKHKAVNAGPDGGVRWKAAPATLALSDLPSARGGGWLRGEGRGVGLVRNRRRPPTDPHHWVHT